MTDPVPRRSGHSLRGRVDQHAVNRHVRAFSAAGHEYTHGEGKVIAYAEQPSVTIERADGTRFSWMAHLCELIDPPPDADSDIGIADEDWLTANTVAWSLEVNPERLIYLNRRDYLTEQSQMANDDIPEDLDELVAAEHMYEVRCYPTSAVGFLILHDTDRSSAIRQMREAVQSDHDH